MKISSMAVGKGFSRVRKTENFLQSKIGKLDIDFEESTPSKEDWQEMLKGCKAGDKVRIGYVLIKQ